MQVKSHRIHCVPRPAALYTCRFTS